MAYICHPKSEQRFRKNGNKMVVVAQLVRAPGCGSGGRRFDSDLPPHYKKADSFLNRLFAFIMS